jgi:hypothetical protein
MEYAAEMGSDVMICVPSFEDTGSDIQALISGGDSKIRRMEIA